MGVDAEKRNTFNVNLNIKPYISNVFSNISQNIHNGSDYFGQFLDGSHVTHTYTDKPVLTKTDHFTAILADTAYSLANTNNTNDYSQERFMNQLQDYGKKYNFHQETINNLRPLVSNQDFIYLKNTEQILYNGKPGNVCFMVARGSEFNTRQTAIRDVFNDTLIALGHVPRSSYRLSNSIQQTISQHPECIFNIGVGHSRSAHDFNFFPNVFDKLNSFEQGQTLWDIRYYLNKTNSIDGRNVTDFRVSCDPISKGVGPLNGHVVHFVTEKDGIRQCHSMKSWIEDVTIKADEFNFKTPMNADSFMDNLNYEDNMTHIPDGFFTSIKHDNETASNNLNQTGSTLTGLPGNAI